MQVPDNMRVKHPNTFKSVVPIHAEYALPPQAKQDTWRLNVWSKPSADIYQQVRCLLIFFSHEKYFHVLK